MQCNHAQGSTVYSCTCPKGHAGPCDKGHAGMEKNSHSNGHAWYSFPHKGEGTWWDYETYTPKRGCRRMKFHASCVIDSLATAAKCPIKCSPANSQQCVSCVNKLSDADKKKVWDHAVWDGGCSDLNSPSDPLNRRRRHANRGAAEVQMRRGTSGTSGMSRTSSGMNSGMGWRISRLTSLRSRLCARRRRRVVFSLRLCPIRY